MSQLAIRDLCDTETERLMKDYDRELNAMREEYSRGDFVHVLLVDDLRAPDNVRNLKKEIKEFLIPDLPLSYEEEEPWKIIRYGCLYLVITRSQAVAQALVKKVSFDIVLCDLKLNGGKFAPLALHNGGFYVWDWAMQVSSESRNARFYIYTTQQDWQESLRPILNKRQANPRIYDAGENGPWTAFKADLRDIRSEKIRTKGLKIHSSGKLLRNVFRSKIQGSTTSRGFIEAIEECFPTLLAPEKARLIQSPNGHKLEYWEQRLLFTFGRRFPEILSSLEQFLNVSSFPGPANASPDTVRHHIKGSQDSEQTAKWLADLLMMQTHITYLLDQYDISEVREFRRVLASLSDSSQAYIDGLLTISNDFDAVYSGSRQWFEEWTDFERLPGRDRVNWKRLSFWREDLRAIWQTLQNNARGHWHRGARVVTEAEEEFGIVLDGGMEIDILVQTDDRTATDEEVVKAHQMLETYPPRPHKLSHLRFLVCDVYNGKLRWCSGKTYIECQGHETSAVRQTDEEFNGVFVQMTFPLL